MLNRIYLVGQISANNIETYEGRKKVKDYFKTDKNFEIIDPCKNNFNKSLIGEESSYCRETYRRNNINILSTKDKMCVERSNIAIANMNQYDKDKPLIGSLFELAGYNSSTDKTVIGICEDKNSIYYIHPFIQQSVTTWVGSVLEACEVIEFYFGGC